MKEIKIELPFTNEKIRQLKIGDRVLLTGYMLTARDAAHKRLYDLIKNRQPLPVDIKGETIYYVGPAPAKEGYAVGPAGPTSSYRMDKYTPALLDMGLKAMIGKGERSAEITESIKKNCCVYLASIGGAAALIAKTIKSCEPVCYDDLGTEAIQRYYVEDFPCIVAIDCEGNDIYWR